MSYIFESNSRIQKKHIKYGYQIIITQHKEQTIYYVGLHAIRY